MSSKLTNVVLSSGNDEARKDRLFVFGYKDFICGWGSAFINIVVTYPVNKLIFRQMLHGFGVGNAFNQLFSEGIHFLYRGILPPLCQKTISASLMFGIYEECRKPLIHLGIQQHIAKSTAATVAGSVETLIMPFERIQTLLQNEKFNTKFKNTFHAFKVIYVKHGATEFYRGLVPILIRNCGANISFFILRDEVKYKLPAHNVWWYNTVQEFLSGALIGAFTSTVFYPLNVLKVNIQSKLGGQFESTVEVMVQIIHERGIRNIYRGVHMNYTRAFFSWGIINAAYEFLCSSF